MTKNLAWNRQNLKAEQNNSKLPFNRKIFYDDELDQNNEKQLKFQELYVGHEKK